jgi:hypothetical protein
VHELVVPKQSHAKKSETNILDKAEAAMAETMVHIAKPGEKLDPLSQAVNVGIESQYRDATKGDHK